jgi:hypothetical protein
MSEPGKSIIFIKITTVAVVHTPPRPKPVDPVLPVVAPNETPVAGAAELPKEAPVEVAAGAPKVNPVDVAGACAAPKPTPVAGVAPTVAVGLVPNERPEDPNEEPNPVVAVGAEVLVAVPKLKFTVGAAAEVVPAVGVPKENFGAVDCEPNMAFYHFATRKVAHFTRFSKPEEAGASE